MKLHAIPAGHALRGFISAQLAVVLTVIAAGATLLTYEWQSAHPSKHHSGSGLNHHHHKHTAETAAN